MKATRPRIDELDEVAVNGLEPDRAFERGRTDSGWRDPRARLRVAKRLFLLAAGLSFVASVSLWFLVDREQGLFVGLWVPSILSLGGLMLAGSGGSR